MNLFQNKLSPLSAKAQLQCRLHKSSLTLKDEYIPLEGNSDWQVVPESFPESNEWIITLRRKGDTLENASIAINFNFQEWSREHYVFMPAAAYAGNRFESRKIPYPPILDNGANLNQESPPIITDIPRLNIEDGPSSLVQLTRDCTTPMVAVWDPNKKHSFFAILPNDTRFGDTGLEVVESEDRHSASINLRVPGIRPKKRYSFCSTTDIDSPDRGIGIPPGLNITIRLQVHVYECKDLREFYAQFFKLRNNLSNPREFTHDAPFSEAWEILENKYNKENWHEEGGYYRIGSYDDNPVASQDWQTGWVGGLMFTLPQIGLGSKTTRKRAISNIDFALSNLTTPSGLLIGKWSEGKAMGDYFRDTSIPWVMIRKNGDALYFLLKEIDLLQKQDETWCIPSHWKDAIKNLANAFVEIWENNKQFGQFLDYNTGEIVVGGSTSGGIVPGALALASQFFDEPKYLEIAEISAHSMVTHFAEKGITTGGPGEILQCPDSESAFGLFESLVVIAELTQKPEWIRDAEFLAHQCASWCVSYDYPFPEESEFGRLGLKSRGSVWASVQNKHSAPGICTFSGDSLLKLYRLTQNTAYLDLIQEIAHNITQYLSRDDRRIRGFKITDVGNYATMFETPAGWMSERVQLSDFSEPTGEIFAGSCWCETSCMLTIWEIPGLYVSPDKGLVVPIDHIDVQILNSDPKEFTVRIHNPTKYKATVKVLVEKKADLKKPLGVNALHDVQEIVIHPNEIITEIF